MGWFTECVVASRCKCDINTYAAKKKLEKNPDVAAAIGLQAVSLPGMDDLEVSNYIAGGYAEQEGSDSSLTATVAVASASSAVGLVMILVAVVVVVFVIRRSGRKVECPDIVPMGAYDVDNSKEVVSDGYGQTDQSHHERSTSGIHTFST